MQRLTPNVIKQLNNLPGFPAIPNTNPPSDEKWILGDYLSEIKVRPGVANLAQLPVSDNNVGDVRIVVSEQAWYFWDGGSWVPITGGGGGGANPEIAGQTTAGLLSGQIAYLSGSNTWTAASADGTLLQAQSLGVYTGTPGSVNLSGSTVVSLQCTTDGGIPAINGRLFLASSSEDSGTGAGKATATAPTPPPAGTINLQYIGVCVDNSQYGSFGTVKAIFQPSFPVILVG